MPSFECQLMAPHIGRLLPQAACATTRNSPNPGQPLLRDSGYYTVFGGRTKRDEMRCHCSHDGGHPWAVVVGRSLLLSHVQSVSLVGIMGKKFGPQRLHEITPMRCFDRIIPGNARNFPKSCILGKESCGNRRKSRTLGTTKSAHCSVLTAPKKLAL